MPLKNLWGIPIKNPSLESCCDSLIREQDKLLHIREINTIGTSRKTLFTQKKDKLSIQRSSIYIITRKNKGPNPLNLPLLLVVIKDQNQRVRILTNIAIIVGI